MKNQWEYRSTNFREAWNTYRKSAAYSEVNEALKNAGIKQTYRNNILHNAFTAGWKASGIKISFINEG